MSKIGQPEIIELLKKKGRPMTTNELADALGITKGCICKSLIGLRNCGLVEGERLFDLETRSFIYVHWLKTRR